jgi:hypothetical protein
MLGDLAKKEGDEAYVSFKRKFPDTVEDAFSGSGMTYAFPVKKLNAALSMIGRSVTVSKAEPYVQGDLIWKSAGGGKRQVAFVHTPNGKFKFAHFPKYQNSYEANDVYWNGKKDERGNDIYVPRYSQKEETKRMGVIGVDPMDKSNVQDKVRASKSAIVIMDIASEAGGYQSGSVKVSTPSVMAIYSHRTENVNEWYDDLEMAAHYTGYRVAIENNRSSTINEMVNRGLIDIIYADHEIKGSKRPSGTLLTMPLGINTSGNSARYDWKDVGMRTLAMFFDGVPNDFVGNESYDISSNEDFMRCCFKELYEQAIKFKPEDAGKFDLFMAWIMAVVAIKQVERPFNIDQYENNKSAEFEQSLHGKANAYVAAAGGLYMPTNFSR